ncbi:MAG: hypothetical protein AAFO29_17860 [Actinomycetota bacterium]
MAFGQSSGPPATGKQLNELLELLAEAGHSDFRDARGPMGFTQRQAGGKFTRDEADEFIEQLQSELYGDGPPSGSTPPAPTRATPPESKIVKRKAPTERAPSKRSPVKRTPPAKRPPSQAALEDVASEDLAAELQRRGWAVLEP